MTEVYEVATFYHHFDVVKEDDTRAAVDHRARVRNASPAGWRARDALRRELAALARARRARARRAVHRTLRARAGGGGRTQPGRRGHRRQDRRRRSRNGRVEPDAAAVSRPRRLSRRRRLRRCSKSASTASARRRGDRRDGKLGAARPGRRGLSGRAASGRSCAREPAPRLMAVNIDEGEPGTFKDRYYLERDPHRFLEGMLIAAWAVGIDAIYVYLRDEYAALPRAARPRDRGARGRSAVRVAGDPPAPRRGRVHLRRRVGDDRVDRRQARHAAPAPAVRRASRPVRPAHARAQHGDAVLGARDPGEGRGVVRRAGPQRPQGTALVLGVGPRAEARRASRAGGHHGARADRRVLRRHAGRATSSTATCPAARRAASCRHRWATSRSTSTRCSRTAASSARRR